LRQACDPGRQDRDPGKQKLKGVVRTETHWRHYCQHLWAPKLIHLLHSICSLVFLCPGTT
jgi:hypothetical protein